MNSNQLTLKVGFFQLVVIVVFVNAVLSLFFVEYELAVPVETFFELTFFLYCFSIFQFSNTRRIYLLNAILTIFYVIGSFTYAVLLNGANVLDFLMIFKALIYLFCLFLIAGKPIIRTEQVFKFFYGISVFFLVKYFLLQLFSLSDRPTLFVENNFELMFLYSIYLIKYDREEEIKTIDVILLVVITLLSLSRSSIVILAALLGYIYIRNVRKRYLILILPFLGAIGLGLIALVFSGRSESSLEEIDRYRFFLVWLDNVKEWGFWDFLFGASRITPLTFESCKALSFYQNLFSFKRDGTCYSVIVHSYVLRVIFDHGLIVFGYISGMCYLLIKNSGMKKDLSLLFTFLILLNGLSVSSFNNIFAALGIAIMITTKK